MSYCCLPILLCLFISGIGDGWRAAVLNSPSERNFIIEGQASLTMHHTSLVVQPIVLPIVTLHTALTTSSMIQVMTYLHNELLLITKLKEIMVP